MFRKAIVDLPLHNGKCPPWLFEKMIRLGRAILLVVYREFGREELLKRLSDPYWFQALGCLLGFDWHSSGLTTTLGGALKKGLEPYFKEIGLFICGGKGRGALNTPKEIEFWGEKVGLTQEVSQFITLSRLIARIDNNALQDGFHLYFHLFIFTKDGKWTVIQQGMDEKSLYARRYHWFSDSTKDFFSDPHRGIISPLKREQVLNLVSSKSEEVRKKILELLREPVGKIEKELKIYERLFFKREHSLTFKDLPIQVLPKIWEKTYENPPADFKSLLLTEGLGAKALRALTLTAELIFDVKASRLDPVHYSFAHGGKDGYPYRINKKIYENTIAEIENLLKLTNLEYSEKMKLFKKLPSLFS
ncbi:MAG: DUF763 domain-containing protein [Caldimicrobium thiodismutans]